MTSTAASGESPPTDLPKPDAKTIEIGDSLVAVLKECCSDQLSDEARTKMLEFGFGHIHFLKQLQGERRLGTCWRVMQLGGVPLLADAIAGDKQSVGFGLTLTGMLIQEENLLSHRFGKQLLKNDKFLPAVDRLLTPDPDDEMMQLLVSQVCNNFMKTATADAVCALASHGTILAKLAAALRKGAASAKEEDWRLLFLISEMLLMMEIAGASKQLDKHDVAGVVMEFLERQQKGVLADHDMLLRMALSHLLLWLMRTKSEEDASSVAARGRAKAIVDAIFPSTTEPVHVEGTPRSTMDAWTLCNGMLKLLENGDHTHAAPSHLALKARLKNWQSVEDEAQDYVRTPEFQNSVKRKMGLPEGPEAPPKIDPSQFAVSSSESESEDEQEPGKGIPRGTKPAEARTGEDDKATLGVVMGQATSNKDTAAVFATAITRKNEGNTYFRAGMYDDAATIYAKALESLEAACDTVLSNGQKEEIAKIAGNSAECRLRLKQWDRAADDCTIALTYDPTFVKALFRRAKAHEGAGRKAQAIADLRQLKQLDPSNKPAAELLKSLE